MLQDGFLECDKISPKILYIVFGKLTEQGTHICSIFQLMGQTIMACCDINEVWKYKCEGAIFSVLRIFLNDHTNPTRPSQCLT